MNLKSKVFSLLLICFIIVSVSLFTTAGAFTDVNSDNQYFEAITNLAGIEVINGYDDDTFRPDNEVTRAEMSKLISALFQMGTPSVTEAPFDDVTQDHWAAPFIIGAKNRGIVNGMGDGTFKPDGNVTYHQAVKMIVCALNYGIEAESKGGWEGRGYIATASRIGLTKKAIMQDDDNASRGLVAQLLFNATSINMLEYNPTTGEYVESSSTPGGVAGGTTVNNVLVVGTPDIYLNSGITTCQDDEVWGLVNGNLMKFKVGLVKTAASYIGTTVNIRYVEDTSTGSLTLTSMVSVASNATTTISTADIKTISDSSVEYYTTDDHTTTKKINFTGTVNKIYNERVAADAFSEVMKDIENGGEISALDISGTTTITTSSNSTFVNIKSYRTYFVSSSVDSNNGIYTIPVDSKSSTPIKYVINTKDDHIYETVVKKAALGAVDKDGYVTTTLSSAEKSALSGARNNVISIARSADSNQSYVEVLFGATLSSGLVTATTTENSFSVVTISSKDYKIAKGFAHYHPDTFNKIQIDAQGTYYVDAFGKIAWIGTVATGSVKAGILLNIPGTKDSNDNYAATFFDLKSGSTFPAYIDEKVLEEFFGKASNQPFPAENYDKLYIMKLNNNVIKNTDNIMRVSTSAGVTLDDGATTYKCLSADVDGNDSNVEFTLSGGKYSYTKDSSKPGTLSSLTAYMRSDASVARGSQKLTKDSSFITDYKYNGVFYSLTTVSGTSSSTSNYIVYNQVKTIKEGSDLWIVTSDTTSTDANKNVTVSIMKFGSTATSATTIKFSEAAYNALKLKTGDVFAYYSDSETDGADIDKIEAVTVFLKMDKVLAENNTKTGGQELRYILDDDKNENTQYKGIGYDFFSINEASLYNHSNTNITAYSLQLPLVYDESSLYLALDANTTKSVPYLPKNSVIADYSDYNGSVQSLVAKNSILAKNDALAKNKVIVYDSTATSSTDKLIVLEDAGSTLENLKTVQFCIDEGYSLDSADLVFTKTTTTTKDGTTASIVYIIKRPLK